MCFAPQQRAIFHLSSGQLAPHPGATNHWKNTVFCDFRTFSCTWIFFFLRLSLFDHSFFSSLLFSSRLVSSRLFSSLLFSSRLVSSRLVSSLLFSPLLSSSSSLLFSSLLVSSRLMSSRLVSSRLVSSLLFSSLLFFDSYHLCFSSVHIVGSLTSKLPSMIDI